MNILFAASEARPFIASGGLADVIGALPKALNGAGCECRVILPLYSNIQDKFREGMEKIDEFEVWLGWRHLYCGLYRTVHNGVTFYFIDNEYYFKREAIYGQFDDGERFGYFFTQNGVIKLHGNQSSFFLGFGHSNTFSIPYFFEKDKGHYEK